MIERGDIWWVDFGEPRGSEPGFRRPVVVVQADPLNASALGTVMVVPLTSNARRAEAIGNVPVTPKDSGLDRTSVALACQIVTVDKDWLTEHVGALPARVMRRIEDGLQIVLGLER